MDFQQSSSSGMMGHVMNADLLNVVSTLERRSVMELGSEISAQIMGESHVSILNWIAAQRMTHLPAEGSNWDKVLAWTQLFTESLHSFQMSMEGFAGDSGKVTQVAYGYCAILLKLGKENASALTTSLGFFYGISTTLVDLLERTEMFSVSQEIRDLLVLAMTDLVTIVASVSTHFHEKIKDASTKSVSIDIYSEFSKPIKTFRDRCDRISEAMWRHQLTAHGGDDMGGAAQTMNDVKSVKTWLSPEDRVLANIAGGWVSLLVQECEELTCLWVGSHLTGFLRGQDKVLSISGKPGCGKTVASSVIVDCLQRPIAGVNHSVLYVSIDSSVSVETATRAIAKAVMRQLLDKRVGNIQLLKILCEAYKECQTVANGDEYDNAVWSAMGRALRANLPGARELVLVVDGIDETSCGEKSMFRRLVGAVENNQNVRLITLGRAKFAEAPGQARMQITDGLIFDDITAVVRSHFESDTEFGEMSEFEQESVVSMLTEASGGSFLWAKLATERLGHAVGIDSFRTAVERLTKSKPAVTEFVQQNVHSSGMTDQGRHMLMWLATAERPLSLKELATLSSVHVGKGDALEIARIDVLSTLKHVQGLFFTQHGLVYIRHGLIRASLHELQHKGQLVPSVKDAHADLATRLLSYIKTQVPEQHEPSIQLLSNQDTVQLLNRYPLLDFAVRHWPVHLTESKVFESEGNNGAAKTFQEVFPTTVTSLRLQATLWQHCPVPLLLAYQSTVTAIYRHSTHSPLTLQCIIYLAFIHRQLGRTDEAAAHFFEATTLSRDVKVGVDVEASYTLTTQMADCYILMIENRTQTHSSLGTAIWSQLDQISTILFECYEVRSSQSFTLVVSTLRRLAEYYRSIKEMDKYEIIMKKIGDGKGKPGPDPDVLTETKGDLPTLLVELWGKHRDAGPGGDGMLDLGVEERDGLIKDFEGSLEEAKKLIAAGRIHDAERIYIYWWQLASRDYSHHRSDSWAVKSLKALLTYSEFLKSQKRISEASALLVSVWEEYRHRSSKLLAADLVTLLGDVADFLGSMGDSSVSVSVSMKKWISSEVGWLDISIEKTEETIIKKTRSITTIDLEDFDAINALIETYRSQHRYQDATTFITNVLRGLWPSFFSAKMRNITLAAGYVEECLGLATCLVGFYVDRRRRNDEEDIRVRIYRALRWGREVDDRQREDATQALLSFYLKTSQDVSGLAIRQEVLDDLIGRHGEHHDTVLKALWDLAERSRPRPAFVGYYQRIIRILNGDSGKTSKPEALKPIIIVATELWNQCAFSDALPYYRTLFNTFLASPKSSPTLRDSAVMRECFDRYLGCLRHIKTSSIKEIRCIALDYQSQCKILYGASAVITIQATLTLARVCRESRVFGEQAIQLYEELLKTGTQEIDLAEISKELEAVRDEQLNSMLLKKELSSEEVVHVTKILKERVRVVKEKHGWVYESLTQLDELIRFQVRHKVGISKKEIEELREELREATVSILKLHENLTWFVSAARMIASIYVDMEETTELRVLTEELYRQLVMKDMSHTKASHFDLSLCGQDSLVFLAQMEYWLGLTSASITEIVAGLVAQATYFEEFRTLTRSKSSSFLDVSVATARIHHSLESFKRTTIAEHVFEQYASWVADARPSFMRQAKVSATDTKVLLRAIMGHLRTYKSQDMVRTAGIIGNTRVMELMEEGHYDDACVLARSCFKIIAANPESYHTPVLAKLVLTMSMQLGSRAMMDSNNNNNNNNNTKLTPDARKSLLETSKPILTDVLRILMSSGSGSGNGDGDGETKKTTKTTKVNLAKLGPAPLHKIIAVLGAQENYETLATVLTALWESREAQQEWDPAVTFSLARRYIMARYVVGDSAAALRIAEHIVYNCRRVHGLCHPATVEMALLLSQLYSGVAQRHQQQAASGSSHGGHGNGRRVSGSAGAEEIANRYYRKSAAIHEDILRGLTDAGYASVDGSLDSLMNGNGNNNNNNNGMSNDGYSSDRRSSSISISSSSSSNGNGMMNSRTFSFVSGAAQGGEQQQKSDGKIARQHLWLLRLALERVGGWPKGYAEYERLNADVFARYPAEMAGAAGVERWNLSAFGHGRASAEDDLLKKEEMTNWGLLPEGYEMEEGRQKTH
ncbi:NACHT domain protein [Apiospora saccharicola]